MTIPTDWLGWFWIIEFIMLSALAIGLVLTKRR